MQRSLATSAIISMFVLIALSTLNGTILALALPFLIYLGIGLFYGPQRLQLSASRILSNDRATPNTEIQVKLSVTNYGTKLENVLITDQVPNELEIVEGKTRALISLAPGGKIDLEYSIRGRRGYYRFTHVQINASDHLNIQSQEEFVPAPSRLFIQPEAYRLRRISIRPRGTRVYSGFIPARQGGPGVEFFGVREYYQGDPLRWINWKASARHRQTYFINEFEQERVADVGIILDTRRRSEVIIKTGESLFEHCVEASATLSETFLTDGNRVGLLLYGTQLDWTFPDYGKVQRERIMQSLARASPGESLIFDMLDNLPTRLFPPNAQLVIVSPLHKDDYDMLIRLRARGYALLIISPDPVIFEAKTLDKSDSMVSLAIRLARIERTLLIAKLRQAGIQVLDWNTDTALDSAIHIFSGRVVSQIHKPKLII